MRRARRPAESGFDIDDPDIVRKFKEAAKKYCADQSAEAILARLVKDGILTKSGRFTKRFR
jgi:hypothetical protein